jgi:hypothetical protein
VPERGFLKIISNFPDYLINKFGFACTGIVILYMKLLFAITLFFTLFNACNMGKSNKKKTGTKSSLSREHPLASRKTLYSLENRQGKILALDAANFGISTGGDTVLLPVNLPVQLQKAGIKINFSGEVKETDPAELWAAAPVLLTQAEIIK